MSKIDWNKSFPKGNSSKENDLPWYQRDIQLGGGKWNDKKKEQFYGEFGLLFQSGVDISMVLELLEEGFKTDKDKAFIKGLRNQIIEGASLSEAMEKTDYFTPYEVFSIKIGEESGNLVPILQSLKNYFEKKIGQRRQFINAMIYPIMVMLVAGLAVFVMMYWVVPLFEGMFQRMDKELPWLTQKVINSSRFVQDNFKWLLMGLVSTIGLWWWQRKQEWYQKYSALLLLKIPVLGDMILKNHLFTMTHALALLAKARTPLDHALRLTEDMMDFYPIKQALQQVQKDLMKGDSLHQGLRKFDFFPQQLVVLVKVGEEVNKLDEIFEKLSSQYESELSYQGKLLANLIEPLLIIVLGAIVVTILIAMYTPLFNLSSAF